MAKIAIVDDDPDIVEAIQTLLVSNGYTPITAYNPDDAIELVKNEKPDLIILDIMIIEADDGFYLANKFRKLGITAPIILLTSIGKVTGFDYGTSEIVPADLFLEKPVQSKVLLEKIADLLK